MPKKFIVFFDKIRSSDIKVVGGKNANIGEMTSFGLPVPFGFAITTNAYEYFMKANKIDKFVENEIKNLNTSNRIQLTTVGKKIRTSILNTEMPFNLENEILNAYEKLKQRTGEKLSVAVRSSATAEDLATASFAGQMESFLNVTKQDLIHKVKHCFASLFTDRVISYRADKKIYGNVRVSVGVQKMVNSDVSGVMFTIDPNNGFEKFIVINASYGLGDYIVQGVVNPDEFTVFKPTLGIVEQKLGDKKIMETYGKYGVRKQAVNKKEQTKFCLNEKQIKELAQVGLQIEKHYKRPMDVEFAIERNKLYVVQARPETVHSAKKENYIERYILKEKSKILVSGQAVGRKIGSGEVNIIKNPKEIYKFKQGQILVTELTNPDWEPIMKIASGIVTEKGGSTSHAAIISRELGIPCIVGAVNAIKIIGKEKSLTVDCSNEAGMVWKGLLKFKVEKTLIKKIPETKTGIFVNVASPEQAFEAGKMPVDGIGLAREEFIISSQIGEHPISMIEHGRQEFFIKKLSESIGKICAYLYPRPVIVRFSDFKTNEYANLKGGEKFEGKEANPMIGFRGASRYIDKSFEPGFRLECRAMKIVAERMGLKNLKVMIPFCRTIEEANAVLKIIKNEKLKTEIYVMAEIPSNVILADEFNKLFDGYSIGSNDLTQLTLGVDRDNETLSKTFNENNTAVKRLIRQLIETAHKHKRKVGICGEAPSKYPDFVRFLVECGIDSISVNPDVAVETKLMVKKIESG